jgi:hypothetical protein
MKKQRIWRLMNGHFTLLRSTCKHSFADNYPLPVNLWLLDGRVIETDELELVSASLAAGRFHFRFNRVRYAGEFGGRWPADN